MSILDVKVYPDPVLRETSQDVDLFDDELRRLIADMRETMLASNGVGLAAPQVGVLKKIAVIEWEKERHALINPKIIEAEGTNRRDEGCLSFPGVYEDVERPERVRVAYQDEHGEHREIEAEGFLARIFAHEIDHLGGKLLIDQLSPLKRTFIRKKMARKAKTS